MENTEFNFDALPIVIGYKGETERDGWKCDMWGCEFRHGNDFFTIDYFTGLGLRKNGNRVTPSKESVMHSVLVDSDAANYTFEQWCDEYDYSDDSIKAQKLYGACIAISVSLKKMFSESELQTMRDALSDY